MKLWCCALAFYITVVAPIAEGTAQGPDIDYDTFMQSDTQGRIKLFNVVTPDNRAQLVRTHLERWLAINRHRLSAEQIAAMQENLAFVRPDIYKEDRGPEVLQRQQELERRSAALFSTEEMRQALTIHANYIPKR